MKRAERRHHRKRIVKRFHIIFTGYYNWYTGYDGADPLMSARKNAGRGSMGCGCVMCANPRRNGWDEPKTRKELLNDYNYHEQVKEYFEDRDSEE